MKLVEQGKCSARAACRYFRLGRSSYRYAPQGEPGWMGRLREAVRELSVRHGAWGYTKIAKLLRNDGWAVGKDLVARLRREMNLRIPPKPPKKVRRGESTGRPTEATHRGHVWSWDFIHGRTERGGAFKVLTIMDEYTRECHRLHVDRRINAEVVRAVMDAVVAEHGAPGYIRSDNGSELTVPPKLDRCYVSPRA